MSDLFAYASGYPDFYRSQDALNQCGARGDAFETRVISGEVLEGLRLGDPQNPCERWWPRTIDFRQEAQRRAGRGGRAVEVASFNHLIEAIRRHPGGRLDNVSWFGHGARGELQFGGGQRLTQDNLASISNISQYFNSSGRLILYACNVGGGTSQAFIQSLANQLGIRVCGFSRGVRWNIEWDAQRHILRRGVVRSRHDAIGGPLPEPDVCADPAP